MGVSESRDPPPEPCVETLRLVLRPNLPAKKGVTWAG
jgi:hypothetical protein